MRFDELGREKKEKNTKEYGDNGKKNEIIQMLDSFGRTHGWLGAKLFSFATRYIF